MNFKYEIQFNQRSKYMRKIIYIFTSLAVTFAFSGVTVGIPSDIPRDVPSECTSDDVPSDIPNHVPSCFLSDVTSNIPSLALTAGTIQAVAKLVVDTLSSAPNLISSDVPYEVTSCVVGCIPSIYPSTTPTLVLGDNVIVKVIPVFLREI